MKKFIIVLMLACLSFSLMAQQPDTVNRETPGSSNKGSDLQNNQTKKDTTRLKLGNKGIAIVEDGSGTNVKITDLDEGDKNKEDNSSDENDDHAGRKGGKFKGHWSGIDLGINNFMDRSGSLTRNDPYKYMDLNTGRSWDINLNIMQYSFGFGTNTMGLVTGLGFEFNNYFFDGNNSIRKDSLGNVGPFYGSTPGNYSPQGVNLDVSKLATVYLTVPLLMEFQLPASAPRNKRIHIAAGVIGGLKLGSHTKEEFYLDNKKQKIKVRDDFDINSLRYGFTARVGYHGLNLFANYYATPFFEKGRGPELYPVAVGLTLGF